MVNGSLILQSAWKRQHSISFIYRFYHLPMPDPSPSTLTVLNSNFLQLGRRSGNVSFFPIASIPSVALDASSGLKAWHGREGCGLLLRNLRNRLWVGHKFTKNNNLKNTAPENMEFLVLYCFQWTRGLPTRLFIQLLPWLVYLLQTQMWPPANSVLPQLPGSKLALFVAFTRIYSVSQKKSPPP